MVGARISSPHCSLLFTFFCLKYSFRFFFVNSCLSRGYNFHSHRVNLARPNLCRSFAGFLFLPPFHFYFAQNFVFQFNFVALFVESHIVLSFRNLDFVHTE